MKIISWVVVANTAQAKIFLMLKFPDQIEEIKTLEHPESRLRNQDLVSSQPGRTYQSVGFRRSSYEADTDPQHLEFEKFAKDLAQYLSTAHQKGEFTRLYIMAGPEFLGLLRQHLDPQTQTAIAKEITKDIAFHKKTDVEKVLAGQL